jgi:ATP-binding cassette subfamily B protein
MPTGTVRICGAHHLAAGSAAQVLNLLVNTLGRDAMSLAALAGVMVYQAPVMSVLAFLVMPAVLLVRKLMKRVRADHAPSMAAALISKTMQETVQGFKITRPSISKTACAPRSRERRRSRARSNKLARVSNRSTPLMEALGGVAIGLVFLYGGYRVLRARCRARRIRVVHHCLPARL